MCLLYVFCLYACRYVHVCKFIYVLIYSTLCVSLLMCCLHCCLSCHVPIVDCHVMWLLLIVMSCAYCWLSHHVTIVDCHIMWLLLIVMPCDYCWLSCHVTIIFISLFVWKQRVNKLLQLPTNWAIVWNIGMARRHQSSTLLALCEGKPPVTGGFPSQRASNV